MFTKLLPYYGKYKYPALMAPLFVIIETICELSLPLIGASIIDVGIANGNRDFIIQRGILMLGVTLISMICGVLSARAGTFANQGYAGNLRRALFDKIQEFSFADIDRFSSGSLITRITNDINVITMMLAMVIRMLPRSAVQLVGALVITISISPKLSVVLLVVLPVLVAVVGIVMKFSYKLFQAMQTRVDNLNNTVQENLVSMRVVKAYVRQEHEKKKFFKVNTELTEAAIAAFNRVILMQPFMMLCMNAAIIGVLWFGGQMIIGGTLPVGDLTAVLQYINQVLMSVMMIAMALLNYSRAHACAVRVNEVLDTTSDLTDDAGAAARQLPRPQGAVTFREVSFRYQDTAEVIHNVNLDIAPGEFVAVVGGTGSGKSSLVNLIPRFYDVSAGEVLVDGLDVRAYPTQALRERIGMVLQKNMLFSGTIRENLKWGRENATDDELFAAAKSADIYDYIVGLPDGFDSWVEQGGVNFSGGQKQRLCIARAMIKKPSILILDDSTSAVDTATEGRIRAAFKRDLPGTTVIIIAQRISSVEHADKIIVLDEGEVVGIGNHAQLRGGNKIYQEIYQSQQGAVSELASGTEGGAAQ